MNTLTIPLNGSVEIQEVGGNKYLVAKLEQERTCMEYLFDLRKGVPVVVPFSKRGHLTGLLKKEAVYTRQTTVVAGQWIAFFPCERREFQP